MARYIDAELLEKAVSTPSMFDINKDDVLALIAEIPTADVAPMPEVERLKVELEAAQYTTNFCKRHYENLITNIFEELETVLYSVVAPTIRADGRIGGKTLDGLHIRIEDYNEIKKKYIGD